jgi:hypothetical protein
MDSVEKSKELWLKVIELRKAEEVAEEEILSEMDDLWYAMTKEQHKELAAWLEKIIRG